MALEIVMSIICFALLLIILIRPLHLFQSIPFIYPSLFSNIADTNYKAFTILVKCVQVAILISFLGLFFFKTSLTTSRQSLAADIIIIIDEKLKPTTYNQSLTVNQLSVNRLIKLFSKHTICLYSLSDTLNTISPCTQNHAHISNALKHYNFFLNHSNTNALDTATSTVSNERWQLINTLAPNTLLDSKRFILTPDTTLTTIRNDVFNKNPTTLLINTVPEPSTQDNSSAETQSLQEKNSTPDSQKRTYRHIDLLNYITNKQSAADSLIQEPSLSPNLDALLKSPPPSIKYTFSRFKPHFIYLLLILIPAEIFLYVLKRKHNDAL